MFVVVKEFDAFFQLFLQAKECDFTLWMHKCFDMFQIVSVLNLKIRIENSNTVTIPVF